MTRRRLATAFADAAEAYERGRPEYPPESVDLLMRELHLDRSSVVLDLAAGTGKLTRELTRRIDHVVAVEPLAAMRAKLAQRARSAALLEGTAERIPLQSGTVSGVFVAQAFHWFSGRRALQEISRVLEPRGGLALLWNTTPWERRDGSWFSRLDDLLKGSRAALPVARSYRSGRWREAFDSEDRFTELASATVSTRRELPIDAFVADLTSRSYVASLEPNARRLLLAAVESLLAHTDAPVASGRVVVPTQTDAYWTRRHA